MLGVKTPNASRIFDFPVFGSPINTFTRRASNSRLLMDLKF